MLLVNTKTNNALARCFADHGFPFTTLSMIRHQLGTFCTARSNLNEFYKQFSGCAAKIWSPLIETELDKILKERVDQGNKINKAKEQPNSELSNAELSLIDDIVAHLHDEQVQEIASELALEQAPATTSTTHKPTVVVVQQQQPPASQVHPNIGKLVKNDLIESLSGSAAVASSSSSPSSSLQRAEAVSNKQADITIVEIEPKTGSTNVTTNITTAATNKILAENNNNNNAASLQQQLNSLAGADSIIAQSSDVAKPPSPPQTALTITESSSPSPKQVAAIPVMLPSPPTTSQPLIVIVEQQPTQVVATTTLSPALVASVAASEAAAAAAASIPLATASAKVVHPSQPSAQNNIIQPESASAAVMSAAVGQPTVSAGQQAADGLPAAVPAHDSNAAAAVSAVHQQAMSSAISNIVDSATNSDLNAVASAASAVQQLSGAGSSATAAAQPVGVPPVPLPAAAGAAASTIAAPVANSPPVTPTNLAPVEPVNNKASLAEAAVNMATSGSALAAQVGAGANLNKQPTAAPANQMAASSLANMLLNSINLASTVAPAVPLANPSAVAPFGGGGPPVNQPIAQTGAAAFSQAGDPALPPVAPPTFAPAGVASVQEAPLNPTTIIPPPTVLPASTPLLPAASSSAAATPSLVGATGSGLPPAPIAVASSNGASAVASPLPPTVPVIKMIEPAVLKNIDSALDLMAKPNSSHGGEINIVAQAKEGESAKVVSVSKVEMLATTSTTAKPTKVGTVEISIAQAAPSSTGKPGSAVVVKKASKSDGDSVLIVSSSSATTKKPPSILKITTVVATTTKSPTKTTTTTTKKPQTTIKLTLHKNGERELIKLKSKYGKSASVHDVIVVGEHVEGDDRLSDYDDHSDHHDEHEEEQHDHHEHDDLKLDHKVSAATKKASSAAASKSAVVSTKVIKIQSTGAKKGDHDDKEDEDQEEDFHHHDHEHLLKGLLAGDVIHVDAGEPDKSSD